MPQVGSWIEIHGYAGNVATRRREKTPLSPRPMRRPSFALRACVFSHELRRHKAADTVGAPIFLSVVRRSHAPSPRLRRTRSAGHTPPSIRGTALPFAGYLLPFVIRQGYASSLYELRRHTVRGVFPILQAVWQRMRGGAEFRKSVGESFRRSETGKVRTGCPGSKGSVY